MTNRTFKSGVSREQVSFLPPRVEDYVARDNAVRAIESYVEALDLAALGFRHADRGAGGLGQPPYDPADLLKLYLYGYLNRVRSSRRLEQEAQRNLELIWLLRGLRPGYRTIADFRKENAAALKAANRELRAAHPRAWPGGRGGCGDRRRVLPRRREQGFHSDAQAARRLSWRRWIAISRPTAKSSTRTMPRRLSARPAAAMAAVIAETTVVAVAVTWRRRLRR